MYIYIISQNRILKVWIFSFPLPRSFSPLPTAFPVAGGGKRHGPIWRIHRRLAGEGHGRPRAAADPTLPGQDGKRALGTGGAGMDLLGVRCKW